MFGNDVIVVFAFGGCDCGDLFLVVTCCCVSLGVVVCRAEDGIGVFCLSRVFGDVYKCQVLWRVVAWCGVVWRGVAWCGVVWRGVACCGAVSCADVRCPAPCSV